MKFKSIFKYIAKFWDYVWHDDSLLSWILAIIIAFLIISYIVFPILKFIFKTEYPLVTVVSGSMEHKLGKYNDICGHILNYYKKDFDHFWFYCGPWYEKRNISREQFENFPFKHGLNIGDLVVVVGTKPENIKIGDVIVFKSKFLRYPIIHRVISKSYKNGSLIINTKGDHNPRQNEDDINITPDRIYGKAVLKVPFLGYPKIWLFKFVTKVIGGVNNELILSKMR